MGPVLQRAAGMSSEPTVAHAFDVLLNSLKEAGTLIETPLRSGDKRRSARYVGRLPVRYRWQDGKRWFTGMTADISETGLLFSLDKADPRIIRDRPAQPDEPLELVIALRTTPVSQVPASISCSARHVRSIAAPGRILFNATGVVVDTWKLGTAPTA